MILCGEQLRALFSSNLTRTVLGRYDHVRGGARLREIRSTGRVSVRQEPSSSIQGRLMEDHLTAAECRDRSLISEKTVCPFNEQHVVFVPEVEYHKMICPQKPRESEESQDASKCNGESNGATQDVTQFENTRATGKSPSQIEKDSATGCVRGQDVGGRGNHISVFKQEDETDKKSPYEDQEMDLKRTQSDGTVIETDNIGTDQDADGTVTPRNHKTAIEKQLSQSDSDTMETDASGSGESDQERFDYLKYKPSKEEREEFLKLIRQERETEVYYDTYTTMNQGYPNTLWAQTYTYVSSQYPPYPAAYVPFPNSYPVMAAIPTQHPYTSGYFTPSMPPPTVPGFLHSGHGAYECGHMNRPHHRFKRRNHYSHHPHSRYNSNHYNHHNNDPQNHGDTDSNSSSQSDTGLSDENLVTHCLRNGSNGNHAASKEEVCIKLMNGGFHKKSSATWQEKCHKNEGCNGVIKHFVDIGNVEQRAVNGNLSDSSQEKDTEEDRPETDDKKSEQEKQMRKLKKKINEIVLLEKKKTSGATLDCDQLKKLSRKKDFEVELQYLTRGH